MLRLPGLRAPLNRGHLKKAFTCIGRAFGRVPTAIIKSDVAYALQITQSNFRVLESFDIPLINTNILEIGPGINFGPQLIMASYGAHVTVSDRFLAPWDDAYHPMFYEKLLEAWQGPSDALRAVIHAKGYPAEILTCIDQPAESLTRIPDETFHVVFSNAVLEHVSDLPAVVGTLRRITKEGGFNNHQIDFRDHRDFSRPLEFLLMDDSKFSATAKDYPDLGNRWRPSQVIELFERAGFSILLKNFDAPVPHDYLQAFLARLHASQSPFRNHDVADFSHGFMRLSMSIKAMIKGPAPDADNGDRR